jgi:hypothetical protein
MRKLQRKKDAHLILEELEREPVKKKILLRYKKKRCEWTNADGERCGGRSAGKGNFCILHSTIVFKEEPSPIVSSNISSGITIKYDPINHPTQYIQHSAMGLNPSEIAAEFQVAVYTLVEWADTYPMFNQAVEIGKAAHEAWYLRTGKENLDNRFFQTPLFKFLTMNNGMGWTDKAETKSTQQGNFGVLLIPGQMSIDEWEQKNIQDDAKMKEIIQQNQLNTIDHDEVINHE